MTRIVWHHDMCQSHGQCQIAAPHLFTLVGEREVQYPTEIDQAQVDDAWAAADACPMQAITIEED
jgi:ferredoxin